MKISDMESCLRDFQERAAHGEDFGPRDLKKLAAMIKKAANLRDKAHKALDDAQDFARQILSAGWSSK